MLEAGDPGLLAGAGLGADIDLACRVLAHQHHGQSRTARRLRGKGRRRRTDARAQCFGKGLAVDSCCIAHQ